ncbi:MAG: flagellar hook-basal body complex protein FliE [Candidatus Verstraetearchaeota archaeon]|jgi:dephospho-CoA kinase|nr:flagellar hook-basal body complex protein FliE [Candidatus Verstraetearchaeota archaeon]
MIKFFCITGMPGAGKSVVAEAAKSLGLKVIVMGDIIREEAKARNIKQTPESLRELMIKLRNEEGLDVIAKRCLKKISNEKIIVIEGVRSLEELEYFKKFGSVCLIAVHASPKTRFNRLIKRNREDDPKDFKTFVERDMTELRIGIGSVIALADKVFVNEGTIEELIEAAKEFFKREINECKSSC